MGESVLAIACLTIRTLMEPRKHFGKKHVRAEEGLDCRVKKFCRAPLLYKVNLPGSAHSCLRSTYPMASSSMVTAEDNLICSKSS
ncbi:hypothetical protein NC653_029777 [Populus alba x Populus x berolinensis]|uniref:Uncharacterized protein n=1 Tax=Populus alba x Populus x berolinensis TaxID=444605 RepID=A0AAD6M3C1_9ROSI|nr:hypothetical protein NC653_029777 [Populus alba x Populus x berolinensis]